MDITIKKAQPSKVKEFGDKQWKVVNRRFGLLPAKKTFFFVAYSKKKIVGYTKIEIIRGGLLEIRDLLVHDKFTGKGIGSEIIEYIEKWAKKNRCKKAVLKVPSVYKESIKFYKKHGYRKDVTLSNYYYDYDWYYMTKSL